jgi:hypothetical protein
LSLIDPNLFKGDGAAAEDRPFAAPPTPAPSGIGFKPLRTQTIVTIVLMVTAFVANLVFNVASNVSLPEEDFYGLAGGAYFLFALVGFIAMLAWFYRAAKNARAISAGLETRPGWAVGYFFVPILSLYRPYRTMSEIWRSAHAPLSWKTRDDPVSIRFWWGGWLTGAIAGSIAGRVEPEAGVLTWVATLVGGAADLVFCYLAWEIAAAQVANKDYGVFD